MPFGDRTGPLGAGPGTGRGAGFCSGRDGPGSVQPGVGRGYRGRGRGAGRGRRNWFHATGLTGRQRNAGWFGNAFQDLRKRIEDLEARDTKEE